MLTLSKRPFSKLPAPLQNFLSLPKLNFTAFSVTKHQFTCDTSTQLFSRAAYQATFCIMISPLAYLTNLTHNLQHTAVVSKLILSTQQFQVMFCCQNKRKLHQCKLFKISTSPYVQYFYNRSGLKNRTTNHTSSETTVTILKWEVVPLKVLQITINNHPTLQWCGTYIDGASQLLSS